MPRTLGSNPIAGLRSVTVHTGSLNMPYNRYDGWEVELGDLPVIGTAIHSGSELRQDCRNLARLSDSERLREEDPFTDMLIEDFPNRIVVHRSRFEVDLNRAREAAVYVRPEQAWGLNVWSSPPERGTPLDVIGIS